MVIVFFLGCTKDPSLSQTTLEAKLLETPPGFPAMDFPSDNAFTIERWKLGKKLFFDPVLSLDSTLSCASCHIQEHAFADRLATSPGIQNRQGTRNVPSLANVGWQPYLLREGSVPTLEMQVLVPIQEENEFDHNIVLIADQLNAIQEYVEMSQIAYGRNPDAFVITRALATYQRTLISGNSRFDQWFYQGIEAMMTESEIRGYNVFNSEKAQCSSCHSDFNFTNYAFENNGLYEAYADPGRFRFTNDPADLARFKVPSLRNVELTAPYMFDGSLSSLEEVIEHYNSGGKAHPNKNPLVRPLGLSEGEKSDLVAFLKTLTDHSFIQNEDLIQ